MLTKLLSKNKQIVYLIVSGLFIALFALLNWKLDFSYEAIASALLVIFVAIHAQWALSKMVDLIPSTYFAWFSYLWLFIFAVDLGNIKFYFAFFLIQLIIIEILRWRYHGRSFLNAFDVGLFSIVALAFEPNFIVFPIAFLLNYIILGRSGLLSTLLCFLGIFTALLISAELAIIFDWTFIWDNHLQQITPTGKSWTWTDLWLLPSFIVVGFGIADYILNIQRQKPEKRSILYFGILILLASSAYILLYGESIQKWVLFLLPFSLLLYNYFTYTKQNFWKEVAVWAILISLLVYRFSDYIPLPDFFNQVTF